MTRCNGLVSVKDCTRFLAAVGRYISLYPLASGQFTS